MGFPSVKPASNDPLHMYEQVCGLLRRWSTYFIEGGEFQRGRVFGENSTQWLPLARSFQPLNASYSASETTSKCIDVCYTINVKDPMRLTFIVDV